jgi:hypothetical protein
MTSDGVLIYAFDKPDDHDKRRRAISLSHLNEMNLRQQRTEILKYFTMISDVAMHSVSRFRGSRRCISPAAGEFLANLIVLPQWLISCSKRYSVQHRLFDSIDGGKILWNGKTEDGVLFMVLYE